MCPCQEKTNLEYLDYYVNILVINTQSFHEVRQLFYHRYVK